MSDGMCDSEQKWISAKEIFIERLKKYGELESYKENENILEFKIVGVSHNAINTMNLFKDISDYCNSPIKSHTFEDGDFFMELEK